MFDKNTVELMIEEQQEEIKKLAEEVRNKKAELEQSKADQREKDKETKNWRGCGGKLSGSAGMPGNDFAAYY